MSDINYIISQYIYRNWISKSKSQRAFAKDNDVEESIVRKIKKNALKTAETEYNIPVKTLKKICVMQNITLEEFFRLIEQ